MRANDDQMIRGSARTTVSLKPPVSPKKLMASIDRFCRPGRYDDLVDWTAPLSNPLRTIAHDTAWVDKEEYPFLAGFLCKARNVDLEFPTRHKILACCLYTIHEACYHYMSTNHPEQLRYTQIQCADQIDIFDWIAFIKVSNSRSSKRARSRLTISRES